MHTIILIFIILQIILLPFMALHDWINIPPLTNIPELAKKHSKKDRFFTSLLFFFLIFIPLMLTIKYQPNFPLWVLISLINFYGWLTLGTILSWWIPYIFTSSQKHKSDFEEYQKTHHFLPKIKDNVTPNTFHVILHLQIWTCFTISMYLLLFRY